MDSGIAGATTTFDDPDVLHGTLLVVVAAAALVWALFHSPSAGARDDLELGPPPGAAKHSRKRASSADYF